MRKNLKRFISAILILTLAGCAAGPAATYRSITYVNENGVCAAERRALNDQGKLFDKDIIGLAIAGAVVGAASAAATGNDPIVGALLGAGLGIAGGYLAKHLQEGRSGRQITNATAKDIRSRNKDIDKVIKAYDNVVKCRKNSAKSIALQLKLKTISKDEAKFRMAEVRELYKEDVKRFEDIAKQVSNNSAEYAAVHNEIAAANGRRGLEVAAYTGNGKPSYKSKKVSSSTKDKNVAKKLKTSGGNVNKLRRACISNIEKRDDCYERINEAEKVEEEFTLPA